VIVVGRGVSLILLVAAVCGLGVACATEGPRAPVFASGSPHANLQLDVGDSGRTIGVESGADFLLTLPVEQPDWRFTTTPDPSMASLVSRTRSDKLEVWTFRANGPGTTQVELSSGAPEPFVLTISVT
jgi:hypothetical protein